MDEPDLAAPEPADPRLAALAWTAAGLAGLFFGADAARGAGKAASPTLVGFNYALGALLALGGLVALGVAARVWWRSRG